MKKKKTMLLNNCKKFIIKNTPPKSRTADKLINKIESSLYVLLTCG